MWLDSLVQNAVFRSLIVQTISQEFICKILFILLPCLHTTKQLRNSPIPVLAESSPDSVNNCEKRYWQQPCKFTLFCRNRQPATPCTQRLVLFYRQGFHLNCISNNEDHCLKCDRPKCALKTLAFAVPCVTRPYVGPWGRDSRWMPLALVSRALLRQQELWSFEGV